MKRITVLHYQNALPTHKVRLHSKMRTQVVSHLDSLQNVSILFPKALHGSLNPKIIQREPLAATATVATRAIPLAAHATVSAAAVTHSLPKLILNEINNTQRSLFGYLQQIRMRATGVLRAYNGVSRARPFACAMITAACVLTASDYIAQKTTMYFLNQGGNTKIEYDYQRTLSMCMFGFFYYGIVGKGIYLIYDRVLGPGMPLFKASFDSICHTSFLCIPSFYMFTGTVKGQSLKESWNQLKREYTQSCGFSMLYWVPVMFVAFRFCTQETRILCVTGCSLVHKSVLSWFSNRGRVQSNMNQSETINANASVNSKQTTMKEEENMVKDIKFEAILNEMSKLASKYEKKVIKNIDSNCNAITFEFNSNYREYWN